MILRRFGWIVAALTAVTASTQPAWACPFCSAVSQTFGEESDASEVVVFAKLRELPAKAEEADNGVQIDLNAVPPKAKFEVTQVLKGENLLPKATVIEALYFGESPVGTQFLIMGIEPPDVMWSTPIEINDRVAEYVANVMKLPKEGPERLAFFQKYLEDKDETLTRDSYDEFAKASYDHVKGLKDQMNHDQLVAWIRDDAVPANRKRLYFTMLSVCGTEDDLPMLEEIITTTDRQKKAGLDAAIACYLTLKGPEGVALVEQSFFINKDAEYTDTHNAIMALRFHAQEEKVIPKERINEAFRYMLDRPQLADLIIPDLARMEDWDVMERLVKLFKDADESSSWVRVPIVNYLRACPLPEAKEHLEELAKIDPQSVKQADAYLPLAAPPEAASREAAEAAQLASGEGTAAHLGSDGRVASAASPDEAQEPQAGVQPVTVGRPAMPPVRKAADVQPAGPLSSASSEAATGNSYGGVGLGLAAAALLLVSLVLYNRARG